MRSVALSIAGFLVLASCTQQGSTRSTTDIVVDVLREPQTVTYESDPVGGEDGPVVRLSAVTTGLTGLESTAVDTSVYVDGDFIGTALVRWVISIPRAIVFAGAASSCEPLIDLVADNGGVSYVGVENRAAADFAYIAVLRPVADRATELDCDDEFQEWARSFFDA